MKNTNNVNRSGAIIEEQLDSDANVNELSAGNEELAMEISPVDQSPEELEWNDLNFIQMMDNGSIITVDKSVLNSFTISTSDVGLATGKPETPYSKLFEEILALKCKLCGFLSEEQKNILEHIKSEHISKVSF